MDSTTLATFRSDPLAFVRALTIPSAHGPARFSDCMEGFQRETFEALSPALLAVARGDVPEPSRFWIERSKGGSKDSDVACCLVWLLVFSARALLIQVAAADQDQASEVKRAVKDLVRHNEWLGKIIDVQQHRIVNPRTDGVCEVIPADVAGSHGARPDLVFSNELSHVQKREFVENLFDNLAKVPRGLGIVATNAGFVGSWQADWRKIAEESPRWSMHVWSQPAPWIDAAELSEAERRNPPSRFRRLFHGEWSSGSGDALESTWIDRAVTLPGPSAAKPGPDWRCVAGVDAGTRRDFTAICVLSRHVGGYLAKSDNEKPRKLSRMQRLIAENEHLVGWDWKEHDYLPPPTPQVEYEEIQPTGKVRLLYTRVWKPDGGEVDLSRVEQEVVRCKKAFGLAAVYFDPWQLTAIGQRLRRRGIKAEPVDATGGNLTTMARELMAGFSDDRIELYPDAGLLRDLRSMSLVERSYGFRLESPRSRELGHGDLGSAFALALLGASRLKQSGPKHIPHLDALARAAR